MLEFLIWLFIGLGMYYLIDTVVDKIYRVKNDHKFKEQLFNERK